MQMSKNVNNDVSMNPPITKSSNSERKNVISMRQIPSLKKWRDFRRSTKMITNFVCFLNISGKQQHFYPTNGKLVNCFHGESIFFSDSINLNTVSESFVFPRYTRNFGAKRDFIYKHSLHIAGVFITDQHTGYVSRRASQ